MIICKATLEDISRLDKLNNSAYRCEFLKKGWTSEADLFDGIRTDKESIGKLIKKPGAVFLKFCNDANILLGCVFLEKNTNKMYVEMLTVLPTEQAKGIGKKLLLAAENYAV
ncbi:MAG: GNAT family N-acetyltransferase [Ginsengibacter sp.]